MILKTNTSSHVRCWSQPSRSLIPSFKSEDFILCQYRSKGFKMDEIRSVLRRHWASTGWIHHCFWSYHWSRDV